jgi:hypothetical protein
VSSSEHKDRNPAEKTGKSFYHGILIFVEKIISKPL